MTKQPILETKRLILRPFEMADAEAVRALAGNKDIATTTLHIPHPYEAGIAEEWIGRHEAQFGEGDGVVFAVTLRESGKLAGAISVMVKKQHDRGVLGYWIGKPHWNQGIATEAAKRVVAYAFEDLSLNKITSSHMERNPASGRVMEKAGLRYEGASVQHIKKWGMYEDMLFYGLLREDYLRDKN